MSMPEVFRQLAYWRRHPPVHELLSMLAQAFTTWRPEGKPMTTEEHRASLEARWKAGAMNVKQMFEAMGGSLVGIKGPLKNPPGIGPFPGAH